MRIAISINGQGRGHLTRMTALGKRLAAEYELVFWCPEKYHPFLKNNFPNSYIFPIPYYKFVLEGPKIDIFKTGLINAEHIMGLPRYTIDLMDQLTLMNIQLVISDFEPFLPKAARKAGLPVIQLNHPAVVLRSKALTPEALLSKIVATSMMGEYDTCIVSSFYNGDVGPIIREEIRNAVSSTGDYYLVYLYHTMAMSVIEELDTIPGIRYRIFPNPVDDFVTALSGCMGVITNAGHQLLSEALHLEKPILAIPMEGQFEQKLNAEMLKQSGRGVTGRMSTIKASLEDFFDFVEMFNPVNPPASPGICFCLRDDSVNAASMIDSQLYRYKAVS